MYMQPVAKRQESKAIVFDRGLLEYKVGLVWGSMLVEIGRLGLSEIRMPGGTPLRLQSLRDPLGEYCV
jgi:hypothetical protein